MALPDHLLEQRVSTHVADDLEDRALAIQTTAEAEAEMAGKYTKSLGDVRDTLISMDVSEGTIKQVLLEAALKGKSTEYA